ncbi:hypothetical protein EUGRSUZ_C01874 [Eucalyptus grandis]|uniref:Uncharacterized protein n=1 Tax=Eucalyptus grandis TaxID=71139 RepID=A0ACC3LEF7_EUCGR|nr:hypothetical protein EUGRSUZ_C01874 [Eucalyptus grandis]
MPPRISFDAETLLFLALSFLAIIVCSSDGPQLAVAQSSNNNSATTIPVNVGVIVDLETWVGKMGLSCVNLSISNFYSSNPSYKTRLILNVRDSKGEEVAAAAAALDLIKNKQVHAIIGPQSSVQADFIIDLGNKSHVPIISFSATSPSLSSIRRPYFIRAAQNDSSQVNAISAVVQAFGWREAVLIYVDNEFGEGIIPSLMDALEEVDTRVPYKSLIPPSATDDQIGQELYKLMTMQTRVFIVHMLPTLGSRLFAKAKEAGMMGRGYVWILTNGITDLLSSVDSSVVAISMQGVLGIKTYVPDTRNLDNFMVQWKKKFQQENPSVLSPPLNIFGYYAYDAARALAMAVEEMGTVNFTFQILNASTDATDLDTIGVSQNDLNPFDTNKYSTSKSNLGTIIWPGDSTSVPKGWEFPTTGKSLKILVPVKDGFNQFVTVTYDPTTNTSQVTGYCIDIFRAVIEKLPYALTYELIPFALPNGSSAGSYNDMIDQVYYQNYDAVVGDTTILANRSLYVDFTLPYTESGVAMLVPYKDNKSKNAWVFLKPLTWDLWLTIGCFFVFIALVVWILEHRINEDFRGPATHQVGTSLWFSFSTMVFAQSERAFSNLTRFVVIVWVFVVLILTQSYTASLSSLLVVQNSQPTIADVYQLLNSGGRVGYQYGAFIHEMLKQMKFDDYRLVSYKSAEECDALLSKGSSKGGIVAAIDEVPDIKLILSQYCNKYLMIPTFKTGGFGFVFPKGSPLVPDISRAILNVTEGPNMTKIEKAWFTSETNCLDSTPSISSNSLGLDSFWGLFLIAGVVALLALLIHMVMFVKRNWHVVLSSSASLRQKIVALGRRFYERDINSQTFRESRFRDGSMDDGIHEHAAVEISENTNFPLSPSSNSSQINNVLTNEQGTPSAEQGLPNHVDEGCHKIASNVELTNVSKRDLSTREGTQPTAALGPPHHTYRECHCTGEGGSSSSCGSCLHSSRHRRSRITPI